MKNIEFTPRDITLFWLKAGKEKWFGRNEHFDQLVFAQYRLLWQKALAGRLNHWCETTEGTLALVIILDQFSRIMFRHDARAYCGDRFAQKITKKAMERRLDLRIDQRLRGFLYMPYEHSENMEDQQKSMQLFAQLNDATMLHYAKIHFQIISWFGRFPQRNKFLGRRTTHEEQAFLNASNYTN